MNSNAAVMQTSAQVQLLDLFTSLRNFEDSRGSVRCATDKKVSPYGVELLSSFGASP